MGGDFAVISSLAGRDVRRMLDRRKQEADRRSGFPA